MAAKRKQFTIETKYQAILQVEKGVQKMVVAADLGISASTLSTWLTTKDTTRAAYESGAFSGKAKRMKPGQFPTTETSLVAWGKPLDAGIIANFKSHCRQLYTLGVLCPALEAGEPPNYELYDAIEVMIQAWDLVTPRTITRCFRHAGFTHPDVVENTPEEDEEQDLPLVQLAARLQAAGMACSIEDANRILTEEEGLQTHGLMSDQDIVDEVLGTHAEEDRITGDGPDWETAHELSLCLKTIGQQNEPIRKQTTMSQYFSNRITL